MQHFAEQSLPHTIQPDLLSEQVNTASADFRDSLDKNISGHGDKGIGYCKLCRIKLVVVRLPFLCVKDFLGFIGTHQYSFVPALYGSGYCAQTLRYGLFSFQSDCMPDLYSKSILNSKKPSGSSDLLHVCLTDGQLHLTQICLLWGDFNIYTLCYLHPPQHNSGQA